jgi:hypothetical protein
MEKNEPAKEVNARIGTPHGSLKKFQPERGLGRFRPTGAATA